MISHTSITNTPHSVLTRAFSHVWGGQWHLAANEIDTNVLVYRDDDGPVCVKTHPYWTHEALVEALWDAARTLVPQQILDDIEYGSCVDAFIKRIDEDEYHNSGA